MDRIFKAFLFSLISSIAVMAIQASADTTSTPATTTPTTLKPQGPRDVLMKCIYTPQADSQSSSLPKTGIGFKFSLEKNNNNEIAVDLFTLNNKLQPVKQVGHAELLSGATAITEATTASTILSSLTLAEDSPAEFQIRATDTVQKTSAGRFTASVTMATTFTGEAYLQVPVQCRVPTAATYSSQTTTTALK